MCLVIAALLEVPYLRTSTLMALAATADLVPRLWFSVLRVRFPTPRMSSVALHGQRTPKPDHA